MLLLGPGTVPILVRVRIAARASSRLARAAWTGALLATALAVAAAPAAGQSVGQKIVEKCAHGEPFGGYTRAQYEEALKEMSTTTREYSACEKEIRAAELAAAGGGIGKAAGVGSTPLPLTPAEQKSVQSAHKRSGPVDIGGQPIRPGVVHANIASAINSLPHSLFAILALLLAGAVALAVGEVRKRVGARRGG